MVFVNMASFQSLTDDDLKKKLMEYGITSPVTATTRDILIKKLNHVLANQRKVSTPNSRVRKAIPISRVNTFSSDEEEDNESSVLSQARRSSRLLRSRRGSKGGLDITVSDRNDSYSGPQASRTSGRQVKSASSDFAEGTSRTSSSSCSSSSSSGSSSGVATSVSVLPHSDPCGDPTLRRRSYFPVSARSGISPRAKIHDGYETGSDSDLAEGDDVVDLSTRASRIWNPPTQESHLLPNPNAYQAQAAPPASPHHHHPNHTSGVVTSPDRSFGRSDGIVRNRKPRSYLENGELDDRDCCAEDNISFLGVTDSIVSHASPGNHEQIRVANGRHHSESGPPLDHSHSDESTWHYSIPLLLLVLLAVFFGVVGMLYVNMRMPFLPALRSVPPMVQKAVLNLPVPFLTSTDPESQVEEEVVSPPPPSSLKVSHQPKGPPPPPPPETMPPHTSENKFPVCSEKLKSDCLSRQELESVQPLMGKLEDVLLPALHRQAGLYQCGDSSLRYLLVSEIQEVLLQKDSSLKPSHITEGIHSLGKLTELNSHWGLEAVRGGENELLGISLSSQPTYILCHITAAIYSFIYLAMGVITVIFTAWLAFYCVRYHKRKAEEEKQQVYELIEQILEVLGGVGGPGGKDYVAVNHVRDSLISPRDRRTKKNLWENAVQFIDQYESRIRREIQNVGGEDCEVWRWASGVPHSPSNSPGADGSVRRPPAKMWQGPAFDTHGPHNVPNVSLTSCLKIRNMFDCDVEFGDSWPSRIQDSILEKCEGISIVHVAVDRSSREGCVYLKCASLSEAGRAFRALHGWWYDGNLVTVKFLRDKRYHQRFPSARHAVHRLRPSNNKRLSLQAPTGQPDASRHT
ncbi:uncharacterized protein MAN1 [Panulirus ornatus]|uniref:uncharacterized protein MAN1 n=1 Tax=Panulirus ornatus TaxID=150431 RepID=UPI003A8B0E0F